MLSQATFTLYKFATTSPISAICSRVKGFSPVQLLRGRTITDSVLISRGPNLVPGLLEVAVSTGTPTTQASSLAVSSRLEMGILMKEAMPATRGRSFWWVGRLNSLRVKSQQSQYFLAWPLFLENTAEVEILLRDAFAASQNTLEKNENLMELYAIVLSVMSAVRLKSPLGAGTWRSQTAAQQWSQSNL